MSLSYDINKEEEYLLVVGQGCPDSSDELFSRLNEVFSQSLGMGYRCLLFDERNLCVNFDFFESLLLSKKFDEHRFQARGVKVAVVPNIRDLPTFKEMETALRNRSFNMMVFDDVAKAKTWLLGGTNTCT